SRPPRGAERRRRVRQIRVSEGPVRCLAYSPDGKLLATGDEDGRVRLWSLPEGQEAEPMKGPDRSSVEALTFSPDGGLLAAGLAGGDLVISARAGGKRVRRPDPHPGGVRAVAWVPSGRTLVSAGWDRALRSWRLSFPKDLLAADERVQTPGPVTALACTPDG